MEVEWGEASLQGHSLIANRAWWLETWITSKLRNIHIKAVGLFAYWHILKGLCACLSPDKQAGSHIFNLPHWMTCRQQISFTCCSHSEQLQICFSRWAKTYIKLQYYHKNTSRNFRLRASVITTGISMSLAWNIQFKYLSNLDNPEVTFSWNITPTASLSSLNVKLSDVKTMNELIYLLRSFTGLKTKLGKQEQIL